MKRIAIIGGGVSGLAAAFALEKHRREGMALDYAVFEASHRFGGVVFSERVDDCLIEAGPDSFLTEKPWAADLCREVGLADELIGSNDGARKTYVYLNGQLVTMPDGLMFMAPTKIMPALSSPLFSSGTKLRFMREWFQGGRQTNSDESVASFVERHYGREVADRLAEPLLSGVYGGDINKLSLRAVLPRFAEMEARHGSLGRALTSARKKAPSNKPIFTSLKEGMAQMVDALTPRLHAAALHLNTPVQALQPQDHGWIVSAGLASDHFDGVVIATSPSAGAGLGLPEELSKALGEIEYSSSVTVGLGYDQQVRKTLPAGFGFLVPRIEGKRLLAVTFVHNKFPHRVPADRALLRCFLGGALDLPILDLSDEELLQLIQRELREILGLAAEPIFTRIYRWKNAMPQYNVGHLERVAKIERLCGELPALALAGNAYHGIGVPDCVRSGTEAATRILQGLGLSIAES